MIYFALVFGCVLVVLGVLGFRSPETAARWNDTKGPGWWVTLGISRHDPARPGRTTTRYVRFYSVISFFGGLLSIFSGVLLILS